MTIEIVDFPIKNGGSFHSFLYVYQAGYPSLHISIVRESPRRAAGRRLDGARGLVAAPPSRRLQLDGGLGTFQRGIHWEIGSSSAAYG